MVYLRLRENVLHEWMLAKRFGVFNYKKKLNETQILGRGNKKKTNKT